jgi:putative addiction module CopG family antidote
MSYPFPPDLQKLLDARLASGHYSSDDDVLRDALRALNEEDEDLVAVRQAIDEWRAGDPGIPLAQAFDEIRREQQAEEHP